MNIVPPGDGATGGHIRRWRLWIAAATFLNALGLSTHIMLACGFAAPFYSGFAQAESVAKVERRVEELAQEAKQQRVGWMEANILDVRQRQCTSPSDVRKLYTMSLQKLLIEYTEVTGREYPVPDCASF